MRTRVYVAGPLTKGDLRTNIERGAKAGAELMQNGYAPLVPHLTCYMGGDVPNLLPNGTTPEDWYDTDLPWVAVSDAVLRLHGESVGADKEVALARQLGIPVFTEMADLLAQLPPSR